MNQSLLNILSYQNCSQYHVDSTISFTGKERDEETGYGYFGARYYDADLLTGWISVDPLCDKYPSISSYNYCACNPIKSVDPDGCEIDGYEGSNGQYQWFDNHFEQSFIDENGVIWNRVTENRKSWDEAITIRKANILSLECLGFNKLEVEKDVRLYDGDDPLFTKESHLLNPSKYTTRWTDSNNSDGGIAKISSPIKHTPYAIKYYQRKGGRDGMNAVGIVNYNISSHLIEAVLEVVERLLYNTKADEDPLYDMHYFNALDLIHILND